MQKISFSKKSQNLLENFIESDTFTATAGKFLLMTLALGGIVFAGALAPGILLATKKKKHFHKYNPKQLQNAIYNLKKRNLIEIIQEGNAKTKVRLTNKGNERVREFCFETLKITKPKRWDEKWRILIFDIPTSPKIYNQARNALREKIKKLGFYQMQKSVWVCPYECEDEILFVAEAFSVQKYIEIITAEKLLHENYLKKKFNLN
ncbi:MAG: hypothetical protein M0P97_03660 [Candidatus Moranbacteria bacterium]|jgi:CRISPR/Cas system-associated endoribonuclease Cas2|nr:hypothetical protein [Candidatus Moranbacteria bacterium]